ncbi:MAG: serine hydrolase domain-containing protein, partial [Flavobacteriaceae bacterium]|nr:serine hydrolase domain-containing protein [Flavobacteriaceae bacterium]
RFATKEELEFEPGTKEQYSNVGYQVLYYLIGKLNNGTFADYLENEFFHPLNMNHSGSNFSSAKPDSKNYAYGHYWNQDGELVCECNFPEDEMRMGNLFSTVDDLANYLDHINNKEHAEVIEEGTISHAGGTRGKRAYIERNFENNYSIIFLTNYDGIPFEKLVSDFQKILKNEEIEMPRAINRETAKVPTEILKKYTGTYDFTEAGHLIINIKLENDSLYVYQNGQNNGVLYPENENTFFSDKTSEESIKFIKENTGDYHILMDWQGVQWKGIKLD